MDNVYSIQTYNMISQPIIGKMYVEEYYDSIRDLLLQHHRWQFVLITSSKVVIPFLEATDAYAEQARRGDPDSIVRCVGCENPEIVTPFY
jgi:hypothetical protein